MAKGIEDTAFYVYNKLISLNEVGGHPDRCESTIEAFHNLNAENAQYWPCTMLCSSTHDTKRSEDVRARLNVLSELVDDWAQSVAQWFELTRNHVSQVDGKPAPTSNDQYLLFQTLLGTWPDPAPASAQDRRLSRAHPGLHGEGRQGSETEQQLGQPERTVRRGRPLLRRQFALGPPGQSLPQIVRPVRAARRPSGPLQFPRPGRAETHRSRCS